MRKKKLKEVAMIEQFRSMVEYGGGRVVSGHPMNIKEASSS
jgi:hypothetical protein